MTKRVRILILLVLIISIMIKSDQVVYGAEDLYNIYYSYGIQNALLVGNVVEISAKKETMKVKVVRIVSGMLKCRDHKITIQSDHLDKIKAGDTILVSLKNGNTGKYVYQTAYDQAFYSVQCMDRNKIKMLKNISYDYDCNDFGWFDINLQWFCNTGEELSEEDAADTVKYYRWEGENKELVFDQSKNTYYQDSFSSEFHAPDVLEEKKKRVEHLLFSVFLFASGAIVLYLVIRRRRNQKRHC